MSAESIDLVILYGQESELPTSEAYFLMPEYLLPVASDAYLERTGPISDAMGFAAHTLLHDDAPWENARPFAEWSEWVAKATMSDAVSLEAACHHGHQYNLSQLAINAALSAQGIAMARSSLIVDELRAGDLRPAVSISIKSSASYWLILNENRRETPSVKVFKDWIASECDAFSSARDDLLASLTTMT